MYHVPIMLDEVLELLEPARGGIFVDGTLGGGGHSSSLYKLMSDGSTLFGIDRDAEAIEEATRRIKHDNPVAVGKSFVPIRGNFFDMRMLLSERGIDKVDGILLDLGVSSHQLDSPERGFSHRYEARLDMRMDSDSPLSAYEVVNDYSEKQLFEIIRSYGEERYAGRIASAIAAKRAICPIVTTTELVDIIKGAMPKKALSEKGHPASRTFQAIRIAVNGELDGLKEAIENAVDMLNTGGVMAVITFHSLEDRIVKHVFKELKDPCVCDPKAPMCTCGRKPVVDIITRKPIEAGANELELNPRARSAKLRAVRKL